MRLKLPRDLFIATMLSLALAPSTLCAATVNVTITSSGFSPGTVNIVAGDTVRWTNTDSATRNVSSDPHPVHSTYPPLTLGNIAPSGTQSLAFPTAGTYTYHDHTDPSRTGSVVVSAPSPSSPSSASGTVGRVLPTTPVFGNFSVTKSDTTSATLIWSTERASFTQLEYGTTSGVYSAQTILDPTLLNLHAVTLEGLNASTTYVARAVGGNALDQHFTSDEITFTTKVLPPDPVVVAPTPPPPPAPAPVPEPTPTPAPLPAIIMQAPPVLFPETGTIQETPKQPHLIFRRFTAGDMLHPNRSNDGVRRLQEFLAQYPDIYPEGVITGYYGRLTRRAVERFQTKYDIVSSGDPVSTGFGIVGPRTRAALNALIPE